MNKQWKKLLQGELGSFNSLCMLFCILCIGFYLKGGRDIIASHYPTNIHYLIVAGIIVVSIFSIGCQLHIILLGEKTPRQLRRELGRQTKKLASLICYARERLSRIEQSAEYCSGLMRPIAYENAGHLRQLLNGLERRVLLVNDLVKTKKKRKIYEAAELMGSPLSTFENCTDSIIDTRPLPPMHTEQWMPTIEQLLSSLEFEAQRASAKIKPAA